MDNNKKPALVRIGYALAGTVVFGILASAPGFIATIVAIFLIQYCRVRARGLAHDSNIDERPVLERFEYQLYRQGVLYLTPVAVALLFFSILRWVVSAFPGSWSLNRILAVERFLEEISRFCSTYLKLSEPKVLVVLMVSYVVTSMLSSRGERVVRRWYRLVEAYTRYSGPAAAGLATFAALSLLTVQVTEPAAQLQLRWQNADRQYGEYAHKVKITLTGTLARKVYQKVLDGFPASYRLAVSNGRAVTTPEQERRIAALPDRFTVTDLETPAPAPGESTPDRIQRLNQGFYTRTPDLYLHIGHRMFTLHLEKLVGEQILASIKPLTEAVPILDPLLQAFVEAIDTTVQQKMGDIYDRVLAQAARKPTRQYDIIDRAASELVTATDVTGPIEHAKPATDAQLRLLEKADRAQPQPPYGPIPMFSLPALPPIKIPSFDLKNPIHPHPHPHPRGRR